MALTQSLTHHYHANKNKLELKKGLIKTKKDAFRSNKLHYNTYVMLKLVQVYFAHKIKNQDTNHAIKHI